MIILGLILLAGLYLTITETWRWHGDRLGTLFFGTIFTALAVLFGGLIVDGVATMVTDVEKREYSHQFDIIAAADGSLTDGHFFIFGGTLDEEPMYFYYHQDGNGAIRQGHIPVNDTVIYEDQETTGFIEVYDDKDEINLWYVHLMGSEPKYEVHVPKGSVVRTFNFDLEK